MVELSEVDGDIKRVCYAKFRTEKDPVIGYSHEFVHSLLDPIWYDNLEGYS